MSLLLSVLYCVLNLKDSNYYANAFSVTNFHSRWKIQPVRLEKARLQKSNAKSKWDDLEDDEINEKIPRDMRYLESNVLRQNRNFVAIRETGGAEVTNDVYVRDRGTDTFWFVGKVARVSDVSIEQAISRQWFLIEEHAARLRPIELYPKRGDLEIWTAPGDSELDVAYNRPNVQFSKMEQDISGADQVKNIMLGFQGELYENGEDGFRTCRTEDGMPKKAEIETPAEKGEKRAPTDEEMKDIEQMLQGKDLNSFFEDQQ